MIHRLNIHPRSFLLFFHGLLLVCGVQCIAKQQIVLAREMPAVPEATEADQSPLTLAQLKQSGRSRSRYLSQSDAMISRERLRNEKPQPKLSEYEREIRPILTRVCVDCHGADTQEGNFRIDQLNADLLAGNDVLWWSEVFAVISKGEMPPPASGELPDDVRQQVVDWLAGELHTASIVRRRSAEHTAFRRMTRYEYNYALQDLLGLPWNFARDLPPDAISEDGFQNSAELLHMSVAQLEIYHRLAQVALSRATAGGERPPTLYWGINMKDVSRLEWPKQEQQIEKLRQELMDTPEKLQEELARLEESFQQEHQRTYYRNRTSGRTALAAWEYYGAKYANLPQKSAVEPPASLDHVAILPAGQWLNIELGNQLPDEGTLRVRVRASRTSAEDQRIPSLQLDFGWQASNEGRALLRVSQQDLPVTAAPGEPEFFQWDIPLGEIYPRNSVRETSPMGALPSPSEYLRLVNSSASPDEILVDYVEVQAPVYDQWPPASHQQIFVTSENTEDHSVHAREIIFNFMRRAWRRPVSSAEVDQKLRLFHTLLQDCDHFEQAVVEVLATVLASPNFLYLVQVSDAPSGAASPTASNAVDESAERPKLSGFELATRLSMFLWCSIPDESLLSLAASDQLLEPAVLVDQVRRMLADPRAQRFSRHFVHQWLSMELLDFLNLKQHRRFDPLLKEAMQREPVALFDEMLQNNESILSFIHADYTMANERLARHYGLTDVYGNHFRRVALDGSFRRGGLLTQAGLLAMNSDFPDSHPLKRGKWLLESLLNDPPPPPPPAVPQIDLANPEIAKMTLKERIEDHRNHAACMSCHVKLDPWGIAFENYDALGEWRDEVHGKPVDASSELFNHQRLDGMDGLKRFLLENRQDQFVSAMVHKVSTYALGRPLSFADRAELEAITARVRRRGDGLRSLIETIATSNLFRSR